MNKHSKYRALMDEIEVGVARGEITVHKLYRIMIETLDGAEQQLATTKQDSLISLEEALKAMLINGFSDDCVPVVKVKYQIKKLKGEV